MTNPHSSGEHYIRIAKAGIKYRLLRESERTLKGQVFSLLVGGGPGATEEFWAVRNLDLEVRTGEVLGVVGANGSGKSTLLRGIAGILPPAEGRIEVNGSICPVLDSMGVLNPYLTGRQNAHLFCALHRIPSDNRDAWIAEVEDFAELGPFFNVPLKAYSSGMAARLSFSLAVHLRPDILLIDEVLAVGDEYFQRKSHFRMLRMIKEGTMVVLVSHDLQFLQRTATRAIALEHGHLVDDGDPVSVVKRHRERMGG